MPNSDIFLSKRMQQFAPQMYAMLQRIATHPTTCDALRTEAIMLIGAIACDDGKTIGELRRAAEHAAVI